MRRFFLAMSFGVLALGSARGQQRFTPVDRQQVEKAVSKRALPTHYPKLRRRFEAFDTTLTPADYRLLYYGFVFQRGYAPYGGMRLRNVNQLLEAGKYAAAAATCDSVLRTAPVSLKANFTKGLALFLADSADPAAMQYRNRYRALQGAILSSGDGRSCETAFKTIYIDDEYDIMYEHLGVEQHFKQMLQPPCDVFEIKPSASFSQPRLYFDTSESLRHMEKMFRR